MDVAGSLIRQYRAGLRRCRFTGVICLARDETASRIRILLEPEIETIGNSREAIGSQGGS